MVTWTLTSGRIGAAFSQFPLTQPWRQETHSFGNLSVEMLLRSTTLPTLLAQEHRRSSTMNILKEGVLDFHATRVVCSAKLGKVWPSLKRGRDIPVFPQKYHWYSMSIKNPLQKRPCYGSLPLAFSLIAEAWVGSSQERRMGQDCTVSFRDFLCHHVVQALQQTGTHLVIIFVASAKAEVNVLPTLYTFTWTFFSFHGSFTERIM